MLNTLWLSFFLLAFVAALWQWLSGTNPEVFSQLVAATFEMSNLAVEIAIGLIGVMALWLGLFRVAEHSGLINIIARAMGPLFSRLMPGVPADHPAIGSVTMNLAANFLGLDNAATPMGLKAMNDLQELNPDKDTASNAQILFLVLNTSSVTLLPVTIFLYRAQQGSTEPAAVFLPILMATSASTLVGLFSVAWIQKLRLHDPVVLAWFGGFAVLMAALLSVIVGLPGDVLSTRSALFGNLLLFSVIVLFLVSGMQRKLDCYSLFIDGAKEGFNVAIKIIPFLLAMLVGIGVFRASGCLDILLEGIRALVAALGIDTRFVDALPTAFMKPLSGSGARAMMLETMNTYGVDSFAARVAATVQGSTETTFYVLAVYFGSVGIRKTRHAITCGLLADFAGVTTAILACYWFFG
ncbi:MAG: nucleoside recognition domain-containing protein [Gammaproteobacteria bacterium]|nr:nucleoside recognition domain-containing protein [Gammaproteobacteria bacterium]